MKPYKKPFAVCSRLTVPVPVSLLNKQVTRPRSQKHSPSSMFISFSASGRNPFFFNLRRAFAQIYCSMIFSPWPEATQTASSWSDTWFRSNPAPRTELEPIRPGSFSHGPPELVQVNASPERVMTNPPIVSPDWAEKF